MCLTRALANSKYTPRVPANSSMGLFSELVWTGFLYSWIYLYLHSLLMYQSELKFYRPPSAMFSACVPSTIILMRSISVAQRCYNSRIFRNNTFKICFHSYAVLWHDNNYMWPWWNILRGVSWGQYCFANGIYISLSAESAIYVFFSCHQ